MTTTGTGPANAHPEQDLNKLWWDLVEKHQGLQRPAGRNAPDYASKIHIVSAPCYYHNYMMGELFACQVHGAMSAALKPGAYRALLTAVDAAGNRSQTAKVNFVVLKRGLARAAGR